MDPFARGERVVGNDDGRFLDVVVHDEGDACVSDRGDFIARAGLACIGRLVVALVDEVLVASFVFIGPANPERNSEGLGGEIHRGMVRYAYMALLAFQAQGSAGDAVDP